MIAFLDGIVAAKGMNEVLMNVGGIGFQVSCSTNTLALLPPKGEKFLLWVWMSVRDDGVDLFGFSSQEEKRMFLRLTGISGIGPKTALQIIGCMPLKDLTLAIMTGDTAALSRAPGIGKGFQGRRVAICEVLQRRTTASGNSTTHTGQNGRTLPQKAGT